MFRHSLLLRATTVPRRLTLALSAAAKTPSTFSSTTTTPTAAASVLAVQRRALTQRLFSTSAEPAATTATTATAATATATAPSANPPRAPWLARKLGADKKALWAVELEFEGGEDAERIFRASLYLLALTPVLYFLYVDRFRVREMLSALRRPAEGDGRRRRVLTRAEAAANAAAANSEAVNANAATIINDRVLEGREEEMRRLHTLFDAPPDKMCILTGPSDAGKTALLEAVLAEREVSLGFNLRAHSALSVNDVVRYFGEVTGARFLTFRSWIVDALPWSGGEGNFELRDRLSHLELQRMLSCLRDALEAVAADPTIKETPVLAFDAFGDLLEMTRRDRDGLQVLDTLLNWMLEVTKSRLAHCVVAITDAQVLENLEFFNSRNVSNRSRFVCVGDFTDDRAREYLGSALARATAKAARATKVATSSAVHDEVRALLANTDGRLDRVIATVGGRVMDLDTVAIEVAAGSSLDDVLDRVLGAHRERALQALHVDGLGSLSSVLVDANDDVAAANGVPIGAAKGKSALAALPRRHNQWTTQQLWVVMRALLEAPHGWVELRALRERMADEVTTDDPNAPEHEEALHALVAADILGVRVGPTPDLVDAPEGAYFITADSPAMRAAFRAIASDPEMAHEIELRLKLREISAALDECHAARRDLSRKFRAVSRDKTELNLNVDIVEAVAARRDARRAAGDARDATSSSVALHTSKTAALRAFESRLALSEQSLEEEYDRLMELDEKLKRAQEHLLVNREMPLLM